jgi:hypothetical protein
VLFNVCHGKKFLLVGVPPGGPTEPHFEKEMVIAGAGQAPIIEFRGA